MRTRPKIQSLDKWAQQMKSEVLSEVYIHLIKITIRRISFSNRSTIEKLSQTKEVLPHKPHEGSFWLLQN